MGLKNREQKTYVKVVNGKFFKTTDKENTTPYDELEGIITEIGLRWDEFEGKKVEKMYVTINDGTEDYTISMSFNSSYAASLIGFLKTVDLTQPVSLVPSYKKEGDKESRSILVKQNKNWAKAFYTKANKNGLPDWKKVKINGQVMPDKTDYLDFLRNVVSNEISPKLGGGTYTDTRETYNPTNTTEEVYVNDGDEVADDLPF